MKKIVVFSNVPSPYFMAYLKELSQFYCITAVFERKEFKHRDKSWRTNIHSLEHLTVEYLHGIRINSIYSISLSAVSYIRKNPDALVIIANPLTPIGIECILYCKLFKRSYCIQSEGGIPKDGKGLKEKIKRKVLRGANLYLTGMNPDNDYFLQYGAEKSKIKQFPFASLYEKDLPIEYPSEETKIENKQKIGINASNMVLFVGRFIPCKGIDVLLNACSEIMQDSMICIVGGVVTPEYQIIVDEKQITNVRFINHLSLSELRDYYIAADVFVLPTRGDTWGLVINEAMSFGLPVVTTDRCVAGNELIEQGINGYLIKADDCKDLALKVNLLLNDKSLRMNMGKNNYIKAKQYTYERMASCIHDIMGEEINYE